MSERFTKNLNTPEYWDKVGKDEFNRYEYRDFHYKFDKIIKYVKPGFVLDAGCGTGAFCRRLVSSFDGKIDVVGIDFSPQEIEICQKLAEFQKNQSYSVQDIYMMDFPDNTFDTVVCSEVLEHLTEPSKAIKEMIRVLNNGGVLIVTVPNNEKINIEEAKRGNREHIQVFNKEILEKLLKPYSKEIKFDYFRSNILVAAIKK